MNTTVLPSHRIDLLHDGRWFGRKHPVEEPGPPPVPEVFREIGIELHQQSELLAMKPEVTDKAAIFAAYQSDVHLLTRYLTEFEQWIRQAVRCSITFTRIDGRAVMAVDKFWESLKNVVPQMGHPVLLDLPYTRAALPANQLLVELKEEYHQGVERLLQQMTLWLDILVAEQLVGLVEWSPEDPTVCRYHYFVHQAEATTLSSKVTVHNSYEPSQSFGQQHVQTTEQERVVRDQYFRERHVHDIVQARAYSLADYPDQVPPRVAQFLEHIPSWLIPRVSIVAGTITREEHIRRRTSVETNVERTVLSVFKSSPAVSLAGKSLIGWSSDDLQGCTPTHFQGQRAGETYFAARDRQNRQLRRWSFRAKVASIAIPALAIIVTAGFRIQQDRHRAADYRQRYNDADWVLTEEKLNVAAAGPIYLLRLTNKRNIWLGLNPVADSTQARIWKQGLPPWKPGIYQFDLANGYGEINLHSVGVPVTLHVVKVDDQGMQYSATANAEPQQSFSPLN